MNDGIYKRNITGQLLFLRTIPILVFIVFLFLLTKGIYDYALLVAILLAPAFFLSPTQVVIDKGNIEIKKYSLLGFVVKTYSINADNLISIKRQVEEIDHTAEDFLLSITSTALVFTYKNNAGREQSIKTKLNVKEYMILLPLIQD